jgi:hypothetical protein
LNPLATGGNCIMRKIPQNFAHAFGVSAIPLMLLTLGFLLAFGQQCEAQSLPTQQDEQKADANKRQREYEQWLEKERNQYEEHSAATLNEDSERTILKNYRDTLVQVAVTASDTSMTQFQKDAKIQELKTYVQHNLILADNTQVVDWGCRAIDVQPFPPGQLQIPAQRWPINVGWTISCAYEIAPPSRATNQFDEFAMNLFYVGDVQKLMNVKKGGELHFDARLYCRQEATGANCSLPGLIFVTEDVRPQ